MTCRANLENEKISMLFFSISDVYFQYCIAPSTVIVKTHIKVYNKSKKKLNKSTTRMGFEPTRAEHIGLAVQRLNHSATSSDWCSLFATNKHNGQSAVSKIPTMDLV